MPLARSRVSAQGRTTVPAEIRRKLGIGPGSILEWEEQGDRVVVRCAVRYTFDDIHQAIFKGKPPQYHTDEELKEGIRQSMRKKHPRR